jgi:preprotein translocase subunit SecB
LCVRPGAAKSQAEEHQRPQPGAPQSTRLTSHPAVNLGTQPMARKKGSTNFDAKLLVNYSKRKPTDERERTGFVEPARWGQTW